MSEEGADPHSYLLKVQLLLALLKAENGQQLVSDGSKRNAGAGMTTSEAGIEDAAVVENCAGVREIFTSYVKDCKNVETVEFSSDAESPVREAEHRVKVSGRQWLAALKRVGKSPAHTPSGVLAKARVVEGYFTEYPTHDEIMAVMRSILKDLEGLLQDLPPESG